MSASLKDSDRMCPKTKAQLSTGEYVHGINHTVVLKARDDLFDPATGDAVETDSGETLPGLQLFSQDEITGIPDNVGCCEVVSVGAEVTNVKPGDVVFIDFFDVRQGAILGDPASLRGIELYIANDDAFKAFFEPVSGTVTPLPGYVITRRASERFKVAQYGTDRYEIPAMSLTTGIVSGRTSQGTPYAYVIYEEVVAVGGPQEQGKLRMMRAAERVLLDELHRHYEKSLGDPDPEVFDYWAEGARYDELGIEWVKLIRDMILARRSRDVGVAVGELVAFSTDLAVQIRVRGEFMRIVPQCALLCAIDDRKILDEAIRNGKAGQIIR